MRTIEFYGNENICRKSRKRRIFAHRTMLSKLSRQLEAYGQTLLPYEISKCLIKFNIEVGDKVTTDFPFLTSTSNQK
jgi:tmRNA-binding protein